MTEPVELSIPTEWRTPLPRIELVPDVPPIRFAAEGGWSTRLLLAVAYANDHGCMTSDDESAMMCRGCWDKSVPRPRPEPAGR